MTARYSSWFAVVAVLALGAAAASCTLPTRARSVPDRIPVPVEARVAPKGVRFEVVPRLSASSPQDWELDLALADSADSADSTDSAGRDLVMITPRQNAGLPVPFGRHVVRAAITAYEMQSQTTTQMVAVPVTTTVPCGTGTCTQSTTQMQPRTTTSLVRTAVGTCSASVYLEVNYLEPRRLQVDIVVKDCAAREVEVSPYEAAAN